MSDQIMMRAAAEAVGDDAGERADDDARQKARDQHEADGAARARQAQHERIKAMVLNQSPSWLTTCPSQS